MECFRDCIFAVFLLGVSLIPQAASAAGAVGDSTVTQPKEPPCAELGRWAAVEASFFSDLTLFLQQEELLSQECMFQFNSFIVDLDCFVDMNDWCDFRGFDAWQHIDSHCLRSPSVREEYSKAYFQRSRSAREYNDCILEHYDLMDAAPDSGGLSSGSKR